MTSPINVALLGTGIYAESDYIPALLTDTTNNVRVSVVWSLDAAAAQACADRLGSKDNRPRVCTGSDALQFVFQDKSIDAIIMALPFMAQPDLIRRAWKAGKHVLSEKSIERDIAAGLALLKEYERVVKPQGLVWRVAEGNYTFPSVP